MQFTDPILIGVLGVLAGALISGGFNIFVTWRNNVAQNKLQTEAHSFERATRFGSLIKEAINAAIDCMHTLWIKKAFPQDVPARLNYLHAWGKTWEASCELRVYLDNEIVEKYDQLVSELQILKPEDLTVDHANPASRDKFEQTIKPYRNMLIEILQPSKKILKLK